MAVQLSEHKKRKGSEERRQIQDRFRRFVTFFIHHSKTTSVVSESGVKMLSRCCFIIAMLCIATVPGVPVSTF